MLSRCKYRIQESHMRQSLAILFSWWLLAVGFLCLFSSHVYPPGGLQRFDYFLIGSLPFGAYFAGKWWYNGPVFLIYGTLGMLPFILVLLDTRNRVPRYDDNELKQIGDVIVWTAGTLVVAILCRMAGWTAHRSQ